MMDAQQILQAALVLPEGERAALASDLLASIAPLPLEDTDAELSYQEALRRDAEMDSDPAATLSIEEFQEKVVRAKSR